MERPSFIDIHLERKEGTTSLTLRHFWRSGETITQFNIIMPIVTCEIPAVSKDGVELDIPRSAWNDVEKVPPRYYRWERLSSSLPATR